MSPWMLLFLMLLTDPSYLMAMELIIFLILMVFFYKSLLLSLTWYIIVTIFISGVFILLFYVSVMMTNKKFLSKKWFKIMFLLSPLVKNLYLFSSVGVDFNMSISVEKLWIILCLTIAYFFFFIMLMNFTLSHSKFLRRIY